MLREEEGMVKPDRWAGIFYSLTKFLLPWLICSYGEGNWRILVGRGEIVTGAAALSLVGKEKLSGGPCGILCLILLVEEIGLDIVSLRLESRQ